MLFHPIYFVFLFYLFQTLPVFSFSFRLFQPLIQLRFLSFFELYIYEILLFQELLLNLEDINYAIKHLNKISFDYCRYGIDKKLHIDSEHTASPYYVMMKDQELWLIAYSETHETISFFRIDRIKNLTILRKKAMDIERVPGHGQGLDLEYLRSSLPYMYSDRPERIVFRADAAITNQIVDWFGDAVKLERDRSDSTKIKARLKTSPTAMEYWAKQYLDHVEILEPLSLREKIRESLENGIGKYADAED